MSFFTSIFFQDTQYLPNGSRYPLVGGARQCRIDGTSSKPRKLPENEHAAKRQSHHHDPCALPAGAGVAGDRMHDVLARFLPFLAFVFINHDQLLFCDSRQIHG